MAQLPRWMCCVIEDLCLRAWLLTPSRQIGLRAILTNSAVLLVISGACSRAEPPPPYDVVVVSGTPYQRGLQHGQHLQAKIRSFYTRMLSTSLLPYLNRQQHDIQAVLQVYKGAEYGNGQFSNLLLRESARELAKSIPQTYLDEMHGVADGSGMAYEDILVLNTFLDTTLGARSITYFLQQVGAPALVSMRIPACDSDGRDNDDDGLTDEPHEGTLDYAASPTATLVELPVDASLTLQLSDSDGVDPAKVRILVDNIVYDQNSPNLQIAPWSTAAPGEHADLRVTWTPPVPLQKGKTISMIIEASDLAIAAEPPPAHAHAMRPEQLTWTTQDSALHRWQVVNRGFWDGTTQPPAHGFALRGTATADGNPLLAHHFSLLDAGVAHDHVVVLVQDLAPGKRVVTIGWAGLVYGMEGMNQDGLAIAIDHSDTLNNPLVDNVRRNVLKAKLLSGGVPVGFALRQALDGASTVAAGADLLAGLKHSFGWNFLLVDATGAMRVLEVDSNILGTTGARQYGPDPSEPGAADAYGRALASVGADDLQIGAHFRALTNDLNVTILYDIRPQRFWSSYYFPSVRTGDAMAAEIASHYGKFAVDSAIALLRRPDLVDRNDSMTAVVFEPAKRRLHTAAGTVPATDGNFDTYSLMEMK